MMISATLISFDKCACMLISNYRPFLVTTFFLPSTAGFNLFLPLLIVSEAKIDGGAAGKSVCHGSRVLIPKLLL